jgi:threonine/homoserine/homoserine lactone efflux protein
MYLKKTIIQGTSNNNGNKLFMKGLALHITNPKAIFTWLAIVSLALANTTSLELSLFVVLFCMVIGAIVFFGYAILCSTLKAQKIYEKFSIYFNAILVMIFGVSGLKLIFSNN